MNVGGRELDAATVTAGLLVVESRGSAFAPPPAGAPELVGLDPERAVELGEVVADRARARASRDEITVYKSVGVAVQDAAAAALVLAAAREQGAGRAIELEELPT
jgi:ornithine cyclodeaminase